MDALASRLVVERLAVRIRTAAVRQQTGILTGAVNAGSVFRTVVIVTTPGDALGVLANLPENALTVAKTLRRRLRAQDVGIALGAHWTTAQCRVVAGHSTNGIATADAKEAAGVLADAIDAGLVQRAAGAVSAANDALGVFANQPTTTLRVFRALNHLVQRPALHLRVADEARMTRAHWTMGVHRANGVQATG